MAVIYEVTVHVREELAADFLGWLREHVAQVEALPGFDGAAMETLLDDSPGEHGWCVRYRLRDRAALDDYLREQAPRMRAEGLARFGEAMRAQRRVLQPLDR